VRLRDVTSQLYGSVQVQPLVALLGIVMGSAVALLAGLVMTLLVYLLLPEFHDRLAGEFRPLLQAIAWAGLLAAVSAVAFVAQLKLRSWRRYAGAALVLTMFAVGRNYWPS
jgi:predicted lysophospholipase L1 biosynthesis ABC-type transport system permease subunit